VLGWYESVYVWLMPPAETGKEGGAAARRTPRRRFIVWATEGAASAERYRLVTLVPKGIRN